MLHAAHTSCFHWRQIGTEVNHQRGEWLIARVNSELGLAEAALRHALRCQALTAQYADQMEDFDQAYALESVARANAIAGNIEVAKQTKSLAEAAGRKIADEESREYFFGDLNGGNWGGLS